MATQTTRSRRGRDSTASCSTSQSGRKRTRPVDLDPAVFRSRGSHAHHGFHRGRPRHASSYDAFMTQLPRSGGHVLVEALRDAGATSVFALHGAQVDPVFQACADLGVALVDVRHEASAGFAAEAFRG